MTDQNTFMEILKDVSSIMRTSDHQMSDDEVLAYFEDMELSSEQKKMIVDYLMNQDKLNDEKVVGEPNGRMDAPGGEVEVEGGQTGINEAEKNSKVLQAYMEDISFVKGYTEEETLAMYEGLLEGQRAVIDTISHAWITKVVAIAEKYSDMHSRVEDLIQEGNIAVLMKLNELCGMAGKDACEITAPDVSEEINRSVEAGILSYISEWNSAKEQENGLIGKLSLIHEAEQFLKEENGEIPTLSELAEYTRMSEKELKELREFVDIKK